MKKPKGKNRPLTSKEKSRRKNHCRNSRITL